jgi:hypothetical protein
VPSRCSATAWKRLDHLRKVSHAGLEKACHCRGHENTKSLGYGDIAFPQLAWEVDLRCQAVDEPIGEKHQYDAEAANPPESLMLNAAENR